MDKDTSDRRASTDPLLAAIVAYCRRTGMAESTFGRHVVNDGKFVSRLRSGGRITTQTNDRVHAFIGDVRDDTTRTAEDASDRATTRPRRARSSNATGESDAESHFRFYDNRQKYLLFVSTCTEKWVVAQRVDMELANLRPRPPALRMFDAGVGDGTILARVMRSMHDRFPTVPFYIVGKEISLEDVRLALGDPSDTVLTTHSPSATRHPRPAAPRSRTRPSERPALPRRAPYPNSVSASERGE